METKFGILKLESPKHKQIYVIFLTTKLLKIRTFYRF